MHGLILVVLAIRKNINVRIPNTCYSIANLMDCLQNGCLNLFGLLMRKCISILILFIKFSNIQAIIYLIIIGEYNLICVRRVIIFDVNGDEQIILLQKNRKKLTMSRSYGVYKNQKVTKNWLGNMDHANRAWKPCGMIS